MRLDTNWPVRVTAIQSAAQAGSKDQEENSELKEGAREEKSVLFLKTKHNLYVWRAERNLSPAFILLLSLYPFIISPTSSPFLLYASLSSHQIQLQPLCDLPPQCFMPRIMTHIIRRAVCTTLFSTNCCTDGRGKAQMGRGQFFIGCSVPRSPTHLVCSEKHLCTNLFVTIH